MFATFTVREALTFAARLKLKTPEDEQDRLVEQIIIDLGMSHIAKSMIGSVQKKILSGGEQNKKEKQAEKQSVLSSSAMMSQIR